MTARILAALLLLASGVGVRAEDRPICPNQGEIFFGGKCTQVFTTFTQPPSTWKVGSGCPDGYEAVLRLRSTITSGCAKDVIDAK